MRFPAGLKPYSAVAAAIGMVEVFRVTAGAAMSFILQPWQLYFLILAGWISRQQQEVIEYLRTENRLLTIKRRPAPTVDPRDGSESRP